MSTYNAWKLQKQKMKEEDLRRTITMSIIQKLKRMDILQLREMYNTAVTVIEKGKRM